MNRKTKIISLLCVFIFIFIFIIININHHGEDVIIKEEVVIEENETNEWNTELKEDDIGSGFVEENTKEVTEERKDSLYLISLGEFRLTAYCNCKKCCGKWAGGATASGVMPTVNHTIAIDTSVIPFGTEVVINGNIYTAEDTGSAIKGNRIDIFMDSHSTAMDFGVQYAEVYIVNK